MTPSPPTPTTSRLARVEFVALALAVACGLVAWGVGVRTIGHDYDEVTRAHSAWMASRGLCPYGDFFEVHPPYFALLSPVFRGRSDPGDVLQALRVVAAVGHLLFLGALSALGASLAREGRRWAWLGLLAVATHPSILQFLVEFRIDGWGYALAAWAIYRHQRPGPCGPGRDFELGVLSGIATLLFCPKLTFLPALVVAFGQFRDWRGFRPALRGGLAYGGGVAVAAGLFGLYLMSQGIEFGRTFQLLIQYHAVSNANASFHNGLARAIVEQRIPSLVILAGLLAWATDRLVRRTWPGPYELALLAWLAVQAALVSYPYKQYYAPWFLFATGYLGFLGRGSSPWLVRGRAVVYLAACLATGLAAAGTAADWWKLDEARGQYRLIRWIDRVAGPEDRVVASPPLHPIDRLDTFFLWFSTADPGGFDSEQILARLPSYREGVKASSFRAELEAHPPAVVVLSGDWRMVTYTEGQTAALTEFLARKGYRMVAVGPARFAVRPDCLDRAHRAE